MEHLLVGLRKVAALRWRAILALMVGLACAPSASIAASGPPNPASSPAALTSEEQQWLDAHGPIRYAPQQFNTPFEFRINSSNLIGGITPDLLSIGCTNLGVSMVHVHPEMAAPEAVLAGQADVAGSYAETTNRKKLFLFTRPYVTASNAVYVRAGSPVKRFEDLAGRRIAVVVNRAVGEYLTNQPIRMEIVPVATPREGILLVSVGQVDAAIETEWNAERIIAANTLRNIRTVPGPPYATPQQLAVAKTNVLLASILQKALDSVNPAEKQRIIEAWTGPSGRQGTDPLPRWFWETLGACGIIALALLLWNMGLRREVNRRTRELKDSETHFRLLYQNAPVPYHSMDRQGRLLEVNEAWLEVLGYPRQDIIGRSVLELVDTSNSLQFGRILESLYQGRRVSGIELVLRSKPGELLTFNMEARAELRDGGKWERSHCILHNVTERHRALAALQISEARLAAAQRAARLGSWEIPLDVEEIDANRLWWSDEVFRIFGLAPGSVQPTNELFFTYLPPNEREEVRQQIEMAKKELRSCELDHSIILPDGSRKILHEHVEVICDAQGRPIKLVGTAQDVTASKQAEEEIRSLNARLENKLVALTQPLGDLFTVKFEDLFDLEEIQRIQDAFAAATGVASIITDVSGRPITRPSKFCRLCEHIIRKTPKGYENCCHSDAIVGRMNDSGPVVQRCLSGGLWDAGSSICVGTRHVANWLIGQVLDKDAHIDTMLDYARHIGCDLEEFRAALHEVPRMPVEQFRSVATALHIIAGQLSRQAVQNVQQARFITERKRVQSELEQKEKFISAVAENTPDFILVVDLKEHREVYCNKNMAAYLGYEGGEVQEHPGALAIFSVVHPEDRTKLDDHLGALTQSSSNGVMSVEYRVRRKDGSYAWFLSRDVPFERDANGHVHLILSVSQDITEKKLAEHARGQLEAQLRQAQKMEAVGQLAGGVAHDFNNILAAMLLNLDFIKTSELPPAIQSGLNDMEALAKRAAALTRQLLQFGRRQVLQRQVFDVRLLVADLGKMLGRVIGEHIVIECKTPNQPVWVEADSGMLEQVITNLAVNARDAMADGGRLRLEIDLLDIGTSHISKSPKARPGRFACVTVADNGCGMDEYTMSRIFEPFFTTKDVGKGTGLGLSTVYGVVDQHQGWVEVESSVGTGSVFRIYLPQRDGPRKVAEAVPETGVLKGHEIILLVEDEPAVRQLMARTLRGQGYSVVEAGHGQDALRCWQEKAGRVDLLLTDVVMPEGIGGLELAARLRKNCPDLPVVLMSGYNAEMMSHDFAVPKRTAFLQKPFAPAVLARTVRNLLDSSGQPLETL